MLYNTQWLRCSKKINGNCAFQYLLQVVKGNTDLGSRISERDVIASIFRSSHWTCDLNRVASFQLLSLILLIFPIQTPQLGPSYNAFKVQSHLKISYCLVFLSFQWRPSLSSTIWYLYPISLVLQSNFRLLKDVSRSRGFLKEPVLFSLCCCVCKKK